MRCHLLPSFIAVLAASLVACDHGHDDEPSVGFDACEHFSNGPVRAAMAGVDAASAADASEEHTRYDLVLPGAGASPVGFVKVAIAEAGDHVFFFDGPVEVEILDASGAAVAPESTATSDPDCATVKAALTLELAVGTYTLEVTSADQEVSLVWFPTSGDHGH